MPATFTECYIVADHMRNFMTYDRRSAAASAHSGCTVWHIQDDAPPRDVTEDLAAEWVAICDGVLAKAGVKPREYDDEGDRIKRIRDRSDRAEHAIGWENV